MSIDAVQFLEDIVTIRSHSTEEQEVTAFITGRMAEWGYADAHVDPAGNAVGSREAPDENGNITNEIVLLGHIDTVPGVVPVRREDGKLYGRGSVDAKGPFAAFAVAGAQAALPAGTRIVVIGATEEEAPSSKGAHYVRDRYAPDLCIIGEPSGWDGITLGYKGVILIDYRLDQEMGHTAGPEVAVAEQAVNFWNNLNDYAIEFNEGKTKLFDQVLPSIRNFNTSTDGITDSAVMRLGFRLPPDFDKSDLVTLAEAHKGSANIVIGDQTHAWHGKRTNKLAKAFSRAILKEGGKPRPKLKTGTSDMNVVGPKWQCPIIAYGAGDSTLDHTPHEHVVIDEYLKAVRVVQSVLENKI